MPEALGAVFPATTLQTCIVHLIRNSLDYASWKDRKALAAAIKPIYTAPSAEAAQAELDAFEQGPWGQKFPTVVRVLAPGLVQRDPVLRVPAGGATRDLHHQRHRERQRAIAQDHQDARALPQRRRGHQADLAGPAQHHGRLGPCGQQLEEAMNQFAILYEDRFTKGSRNMSPDFPTAAVRRNASYLGAGELQFNFRKTNGQSIELSDPFLLYTTFSMPHGRTVDDGFGGRSNRERTQLAGTDCRYKEGCNIQLS
jgi:hypothetical protein